MPRRQPFTLLCQAAARGPAAGRADLHVHTIFSDGAYTPADVVDLARRSGLAAVAVTDHDATDGVAPTTEAARGSPLEVVPGVEISAEYRGAELHLLGYYFRPEDVRLTAALARLRAHREDRFWEMVSRLRDCGVPVEDDEVRAGAGAGSLGRRNLAAYLVRSRRAGSVREAFQRYLGDHGRVAVPKVRLPVAEAIAAVRGAGGVAAWAHPSYDCDQTSLLELREMGLRAVETEYPGRRPSRVKELRALAARLGLAVTGGSDCHGPGEWRRAVGACSISAADLQQLRQLV